MDLQLPMQSVPITTQWGGGVDSLSGRGVQHYVIKFVSDLRQVGGFLRVLRIPMDLRYIYPTQLYLLVYKLKDDEIPTAPKC